MPNDSKSDYPQLYEGALRNIILLTLPWLSLQRQMLDLMARSVENAGHVRPMQNFALSELQALTMILDRSGTLRNLLDPELEKKLEETFNDAIPKLASASVQSLRAQEAMLASVFDALNELRKNSKSGGRPRGEDTSRAR